MNITPTLEKTLLHFASYASIMGRTGYAQALKDALLSPEPHRTDALDILKSSISEILLISDDQSEFKDFVFKYKLTADEIKELLGFLGPDSGLKYFSGEEEAMILSIPSYFKSLIDEKLYDRMVLLLKLKYGKDFWDEYEYAEAKTDRLQTLVSRIYSEYPVLGKYLYNVLKLG